MDLIHLNGIELTLHLGVPLEERAVPQTISADIALEFDTRAAGATDDFQLTVDYAAVHAIAVRVAASRPFALVESLAAEIAAAVLAACPVQSVRILIRKPQALRAKGVAWAGVEIVRHRG